MKPENVIGLSKRFFQDWREFSLPVAFGRLRRDMPIGKWEHRRTFYERRVYKYLDKLYGPTIKACIASHDPSKEEPIREKFIWVMWWQGEEQMPPIVQACWKQLKSASGGYQVTLLTKDNWSSYITLPEEIIRKHDQGYIGMAHFSDVLRCFLLEKWGGLWLDATVYVQHIPPDAFTLPFYTLRGPGMFPEFINRGDFSTFVLGFSRMHSLLAKGMKEFYSAYWQEQTEAIDYLFFDYGIKLILEKSSLVRSELSSVPENYHFYTMNQLLTEVVSRETLCDLVLKSPLHKLSYRKDFSSKSDVVGETLYRQLLEQHQILPLV